MSHKCERCGAFLDQEDLRPFGCIKCDSRTITLYFDLEEFDVEEIRELLDNAFSGEGFRVIGAYIRKKE